jgi:hypothetical protein
MAVDTFFVSAFGTFVMGLFHGLLRAPSWQSFSLLACGWALASERHTLTTSRWCTGATTRTHCSRCYVLLGGPRYTARWQRWAPILRHAAPWVPPAEPSVIALDDFPKQKAGRHLAGRARSRNSAGSARQAYRTLRGVHCVLGVMRLPRQRWPGHCVPRPIGLALYLNAPWANKRRRGDCSRRTLARGIVECVAKTLPERASRVLTDGGDATKDFRRALPPAAQVVSRLLSSAPLSEVPPPAPRRRGGRPPRTGQPLGSPQTLARQRTGWRTHPSEAGAQVQAWRGLWQTVLPGRPLRVVGVRRHAAQQPHMPGHRKSRPAVAAFFTTDLTLSVDAILKHYRDRWAVAIDIRDGQALYGLGQAQCRKWGRLVGAHT